MRGKFPSWERNKSMRNRRKFYKGVALMIAAVLSFSCVDHLAYAAVYTSSDDSGDANTVYVAGNPNAYPLEYYSEERKAFCGVFPSVLNVISEKTGVSFTYISASDKNQQKMLSRNAQVELVTALSTTQTDDEVLEVLPVLDITVHGEKSVYGIGVTKIASPELVEKIKAALSEMSDAEKMGFLLDTTSNNPEVNYKDWLIKLLLLLFAVMFVAIVGTLIFFAHKKKKQSCQDERIDKVTGVGNGSYYEYAFDQLLSRQSRNLYAVVYVACKAKKVCDECGEGAVEQIDKYTAARLNTKIASMEYLARVGDGVFVLLLQVSTEKECASRVHAIVDDLNRYLREFYPTMESCFTAGVSRLCDYPDCNAETALYNAKQGYLAAQRSGASAEITTKDDLEQNKKREKLRASLGKAVSNGEFRVYLQFIHENSSEKICGAEALSRWQNREYGLLRPHEYIDLLKTSGQIIAYDYKMFSLVCRQLEEWNTSPYNRMFLTCNFTRVSLSQADFFDRITEIASEYRFQHRRLVIEITEDSIAENVKVVSENIRKCRESGFKIAIDDMGAGFSSIVDLYDNEIDFVKIDGSFISCCMSERQQVMLSNMIQLVHQSGAQVLCEGVETEKQAEFLSKIHCDMMQGFYFSKILPLVECKKFLKNENITEIPVF